MISLSSLSRTPIYQQIIEQVLAQIACGALVPDQQLPGVRNLANDLGINPNTVVKAYAELENSGYIYSLQGKGSFVKKRDGDNNLVLIKLEEVEKDMSILYQLGIDKSRIEEILNRVFSGETAHE
ncbi:MAG: GntR family transcriptional regulator [Erysipelotrichaceae bacterium]